MANQLFVNYLTEIVTFLPFVALMDGFQQWVCTHQIEAQQIEQVDNAWQKLYQGFIPAVDFTDYETGLRKGWQRKHHNFTKPLSYTGYGFAKLAGLQIWRNINLNGNVAIQQFCQALACGSSIPVKEFYTQAGASFDFETESVQTTLVFLLEQIEARSISKV